MTNKLWHPAKIVFDRVINRSNRFHSWSLIHSSRTFLLFITNVGNIICRTLLRIRDSSFFLFIFFASSRWIKADGIVTFARKRERARRHSLLVWISIYRLISSAELTERCEATEDEDLVCCRYTFGFVPRRTDVFIWSRARRTWLLINCFWSR